MSRERTSPLRIPSSRRSLIYDPIDPQDFRQLEFIYCCEQCSHFAPETGTCTIGYDASKHRQAEQNRLYLLMGRMAYCRFMEID